jgi:hypothetical protein
LKKSLAGSASPCSTNLANIGTSSRFFSIRYGSLAATRHRSISFSHKNLLLTNASRSSVFKLDFFYSLAGLGCGEDGGDDSGADPSASLRDLFFPAPLFGLLDGDGFILQVQGVFTRIRSGATPMAGGGGALGSLLSLAAAQVAEEGNLLNRSIQAVATEKNEKP